MGEEVKEQFSPNHVALVPGQDGWSLVAEDSEGQQAGVLCPPDAVDMLKTLASLSNPAFVTIWRTYSRSMGTGTFFWDVIALAEGLQKLGDVPGVRKLLRVRSAGELCHNRWQARLMSLANLRALGPQMIAEESDRRRPDFRLRSGTEVEIKTLFSETSIELRGQSTRIAQKDADRFALGVQRKVADAAEQVASDGIVVVATWCDLTANYLSSFHGAVPIDQISFTPGSVVVALAPSLGDHPELGISVPSNRIDDFCEASARHLYQAQALPIPLTGRLVGMTRGTRWLSTGRIFRPVRSVNEYGFYETNRARFRHDRFTDRERQELVLGVHGLKTAREAWEALNRANPIGGEYSAEQLNADPRFAALFRWGRWLYDVLVYLARRRAVEDLLPSGRPGDDADRYMGAVLRQDGLIDAEGLLRLEDGIGTMARLTSHLTAVVPPQ